MDELVLTAAENKATYEEIKHCALSLCSIKQVSRGK